MSPPENEEDSLAQPETNTGWAPTYEATSRELTGQAASKELESEEARGAGKWVWPPRGPGARGPGLGVWLWETLLTHHPSPLGGPQAGMKSIMKQKEEPAEPEAHHRSLQFVGVNGR